MDYGKDGSKKMANKSNESQRDALPLEKDQGKDRVTKKETFPKRAPLDAGRPRREEYAAY